MSTLLHVILDRAPALATLAQECKGCPGTLCKGCHGTRHEGGCPYAGESARPHTNTFLIVHNCRERFGIERRSPDQGAVDFFFGHQGVGVLWFDGAAVEDAEFAGEFLAERFGGLASDD